MTSIVIPVLVVLGALAGIILIVGRRLPNIRQILKRQKEEWSSTEFNTAGAETDEEFLTPRRARLEKPGSLLAFVKSAKQGGKIFAVLRPAAELGDKISVVVARPISMILKLLVKSGSAIPAVKIIKKRRKKEAETDTELEETSVREPTTADIKPYAKNPLRYPEPLPAKKPVRDDKEEETSEDKKKEEESERAEKEKEKVEPASVTIADEEEQNEQPEAGESKKKFVIHEAKAPVEKREETDKTARNKKKELEKAAALPERKNTREKKRALMSSAGIKGRSASVVDIAKTIPALIEEGKLAKAESMLIDVLSKNPRDTEAYYQLGTIYLKRKDYPQAKEVFEEAVRRDPENPKIFGPLGTAYFNLGEYSKALSMFQQAHNADEEKVEYLEKLLLISAQMDRRPLVRVTAKKILALDPHHKEAKKYLESLVSK